MGLPRLVLICHLPPPTTGASLMGQYIVNSRRLRDAFDCEVIPIRMAGKVEELGRMRLSKLWGSLAIYRRLLAILISRRVDAVYLTIAIDGFAVLRDYITVLICRLFGVKTVFHMHMRGVNANYQRSWFYRALYRSLFKKGELIHLSPCLRQDVACVVPPERLHVVANGVSDPRDARAPGEPSSKAPDVPTVLFLSNLMREKGPLDLLEASLQLMDEGVRHKLIFVGATNEPEVLTAIEMAKPMHDGQIILAGTLYGADKDRILDEADIFAFPSYYRHECQPLSVIEAMASGLAIVASREGGLPDLIEDGIDGLLFEAQDKRSLTSSLKRLITDMTLRRALGRAARQSYLSDYTIDSFEKRFVDVMTGIVSLSENALA